MADLNGPELAITDTPACKDAIRSDGKKGWNDSVQTWFSLYRYCYISTDSQR